MNPKQMWQPFLFALVLISGIWIGLMLSPAKEKTPLFSKNGQSDIDEVKQLVLAKYVDTVNSAQLDVSTINSMLNHLDPHSVFIPAEDTSLFNSDLTGNFGGIGILYDRIADTVTITNIISEGPAQKAGLLPGDQLLAVDNHSLTIPKQNEDDVIRLFRGMKGTSLDLTYQRKNKMSKIKLVRDAIHLTSVESAYMLTNSTGYIRLKNFNDQTIVEFVKAIEKLQQQGMKSLILDLRDNGGGLITSATDVVDELLDQEKLIVYTKGRVYSEQDYKTNTEGLFESGALAILVNENTASAAEIVAGAIQDWDRGTIVGRRTFGKGLVQEEIPLKDGSEVRLTVARYYTPSGRCIQRPYNGNISDYYNDEIQRMKDGELINKDSIHISDTTKYFTSKGRIVHGGGGIIPDIFVAEDSGLNNSLFIQLDTNSWFEKFAIHYIQSNGICDSLKNGDFNFAEDLNTQFLNYLKEHGINFPKLKNFSLQSEILRNIKSQIVDMKYGDYDYFKFINRQDADVHAALNIMNSNK
jgi:carboxyl-terminal processing protease